jgi:hypothetical protein
VVISIVAAALAAAPLPGSSLIAERMSVTDAKVGEWVVYRLEGSGRSQFWRVAAVGEEKDVRGRPAVWLELDFGEHPAMKAPMAQMKVLVARGSGLTADGVTRAFVAFGADRPREVEPEDLPRFLTRDKTAAGPPASPDVSVKRGDATRLVTLGGTVTASPVEVRVRSTLIKRFWLCDQVPLLKVAKMELPAIGYSLEVRDWGLDARPQMAPPDPDAARIRMEQYDGPAVP